MLVVKIFEISEHYISTRLDKMPRSEIYAAFFTTKGYSSCLRLLDDYLTERPADSGSDREFLPGSLPCRRFCPRRVRCRLSVKTPA